MPTYRNGDRYQGDDDTWRFKPATVMWIIGCLGAIFLALVAAVWTGIGLISHIEERLAQSNQRIALLEQQQVASRETDLRLERQTAELVANFSMRMEKLEVKIDRLLMDGASRQSPKSRSGGY